MVPTPLSARSRTPGLLYALASLVINNVPKLFHGSSARSNNAAADMNVHMLAKRAEKHDAKFIVFACLIPVLVLLSGLFAGLTLGYMSLDETQLHVLSVSGTPKQKAYAKKIEPVRKNGHLLLVTLLLANMIVNETLPVICDPVFDNPVVSVVASTVLIVIFSEIIPQSLCTRYGLAIGAEMAWLVRILIYTLGVIAWPVAKLLEFILGSSHGIMYRRAELKELIAMHSTTGELGGDLNHDTVTIIGATLDLQEKVVKQAMTSIDQVFMLNHDCTLDYETMKQIAETGHSRVPVYEEIEVPVLSGDTSGMSTPEKIELPLVTQKMKKIVGILLVKQCLMLDPRDATPLRKLRLNRVTNVPNNMSLLALLDRFQEGRSHMAVVSRFTEEKAASIKHDVKKGLTQRLMERVGMGDSSSSESDSESDSDSETEGKQSDDGVGKKRSWKRFRHKRKAEADIEKGEGSEGKAEDEDKEDPAKTKQEKPELQLPQTVWDKLLATGREQKMPDDAVLTKEDAKGFLQSFDPAVAPLGIITLEDVLEELIGEEIYDEFDREGQSHLDPYITSKRVPSRARTPDPKVSPDPSEGTTVANVEELSKSHSMPASPMISSTVLEDSPGRSITRAPSLGQQLGVLAGYKRQLRGSSSGSSTPRERSRARRQSNLVPTTTLTEQMSNVKEESIRIPGSQEKSGPDIPKPQEEEKE